MTNILKRVGSLKEKENHFLVRLGNKKRKFMFADDENEKKKTKRLAEQHLLELTLSSKNRTNVYSTDAETNTCSIQILCQTADFEPLLLRIDSADLDLFRDKVWYYRKGKQPSVAFAFVEKGKRLYATEAIFGVKDVSNVTFINGDRYDCRRENVQIVSGTIQNETPGQRDSLATARVESNDYTPQSIANLVQSTCFFSPSGPYINADDWSALCKIASLSDEKKRNVASALAKCVGKQYQNFPLHQNSDRELIDDVHKLCRLQFSSNALTLTKYGILFCRHFFAPHIIQCALKYSKTIARSPSEVWKDEKHREGIMVGCIEARRSFFDARHLWQSVAYRYGMASNFPPVNAKHLYEMYAKSNSDSIVRVLDTCSGWGGRFLGFWASKNVTHYTGIDPNSNAVGSAKDMARWLQNMQPKDKTYTFYNTCAETTQWCNSDPFFGIYDMMLTSPPYFDLENYEPNSAEQSCNKYPSYQVWLQNFLYKVIDNSVAALRLGGHLLINVADSKAAPSLYKDTAAYLLKHAHLEFDAFVQMPVTLRGSKGSNDLIIVCKKK